MTTSGTFIFDPTFADIIDEAMERAGVDPAEATGRHLESAIRSGQLLFSSWANNGIKQWEMKQKVQVLTQATIEYTMPTGAIDVISMILRRNDPTEFDTEMFRISREEYLRIADKDLEGDPSQFFVDRQRVVPVISVWNAPENSVDSIVYNYLQRIEDVGGLSNTLDIPYRWFDAMAAGMAARLYRKLNSNVSGTYDKSYHDDLKAEALAALNEARWEDRDRTPTTMKVNFTKRGRGRS